MSIQVLIAVETESWQFNDQRLQDVCRKIAEDHGYSQGEISLAIVDDATITTLNREHLDHDWPTDVISFIFDNDECLDGEVIASIETAYRLSERLPWSGDDELLLYVIHGTLHLVGYDDIEADDVEKMRQAERHYLEYCNIPQAAMHGREVWENNLANQDEFEE